MIKQKPTWRDPSGFVWQTKGRVFRAVLPHVASTMRQLLEEPWFQARMAAGDIPRTWQLAPQTAPNHPQANEFSWMEHEPLYFPCYPHEVTAFQLFDAAKLTLRLALEALDKGWVLKDASAWNVLFSKGRPVFCDVLSFEKLDASKTTGMWVAYAQFCRHFLIPLLLYKELRLQPANQFLVHRDGIAPETAAPMLRGLRALRQPTLELITLPKIFAAKGKEAVASAAGKTIKSSNHELTTYLIRRTLKRLEKHLECVKPAVSQRDTVWGNYEATRDHYEEADLAAKRNFVKRVLVESSGPSVLDLGCNAGEFSLLASGIGKHVVAADFDDGALTCLYGKTREQVRAQSQKTVINISPLKLDVGRPTPAIGWMNREVLSFIDRANGKFDSIMALGLLHHLLVTERVPLEDILELFATLNPQLLIIEWIEPQDIRFIELIGLNCSNQKPIDQQKYESAFSKHFRLITKLQLPCCKTRTLYHWAKLD